MLLSDFRWLSLLVGAVHFGTLLGMAVAILALTLLRLLSERNIHSKTFRQRDGGAMTGTSKNGNDDQRTFVQYLYETIWAIGAGALVAYWLPELAESRRV